ncbi:ECF transporter S component [Dolosigranulum pigrum]|uniref:ECF transporter S component n=1 Tax=Dolosigranulum pigrum TaxID=29394 RepID=UPI001AD87906|nr:ECF transporter S component [Dolosigranulum pigrum]QTJ39975.1 ECF transporter S component [Dolosigranulum pigrum]QTJ44560.1 ECF transporter S component [Dolosigranulum pigrum]QTJ48458.1 ECF transporter S component [Dolosigranulum pigrum]
MKQTINTKRLTMMAIATAILLIQNFVPFLGNLPLPPLNPTIIHITVIVFTFLLGTRDGMIIGAIWGIIRMIRAFAMPASPLDPLIWTNPMIAVLPRLLIGLTVGVTYQWLQKKWPSTHNLRISAFLGSLTNTVFVMLFIYVFFTEDIAYLMNIQMDNIVYGLLAIVVTSGIPEAIIAAIIAPIVVKPLKKIY